jgi:hypothetical protein
MSLSDNFSIIIHAQAINEHGGFQPYELEYSNIAGKANLVKDEEDKKIRENAKKPLTRIDLKYSFDKGGYSDPKTYLNVKETVAEINETILKAQIEYIKALQKHSIFIS